MDQQVSEALVAETRAQDLPFQSTKDGRRGVDMPILDRRAVGVNWQVFRVGLGGISEALSSGPGVVMDR
jgi:hypothetical protein